MANTIAAAATANSFAGISVIRISGSEAISIAGKVFTPADLSALDDMQGYSAKYGYVCYRGEKYDNAVALVFRGPKSYTGEDVVEISVHGGMIVTKKTLSAVYEAGAVPAQPGEFTKRAFLNGKMDLTQAESVAAIISAQGELAAKASFNALSGALSRRIRAVLQVLLDCNALMSAWVDYPDEEIPELQEDELLKTLTQSENQLQKLLDSYDDGQIMTGGIDTAIVGKPNVGKSSLMNVLSGNERSIVTDIQGTTRDIVENTVSLGDLVLRLADTAGIRESEDKIESIGIKKAQQRMENAQLILAVFDSGEPTNDDDRRIAEICKSKCAVAVINKSDVKTHKDFDEGIIDKAFQHKVYVSAKNELGIKELESAVIDAMGVRDFYADDPILANERQKSCCQNAVNFVRQAKSACQNGVTFDAIGVMIDSACDELLGLTGKKATEEVVNNIFSKFCVGK